MSSKIFPFYITVFLGIFLIGCSEENIPTSFVDPELQPFFELFQEEALNRGLVVNLETVRGVLEDVENDASTTGRLLAHCSAQDGATNIITIDATRWTRFDDFSKQYIIFHELGHCALGRDHLDDTDIEGNCESLMNSLFDRCIDEFTSMTRSDLLDELFLIR